MKKVQVIMSSYNGEKFIKKQIDSILNQQNVEVSLLIRDDGSKDGTIEILRDYENRGLIKVIYGKNIGPTASFLKLIDECDNADYYSFSDQDDVWLEDKLSTAVKILEENSVNKRPLLYCSALQRVDADLTYEKIQKFKRLRLNIYSMLVRERLAGCTFVFNNCLKNILNESGKINYNYPHDSWTVLVCYACGGEILFDSHPHILFRRYGTNVSVDGGNIVKRIKHEFRYFRKYKNQRYQTVNILMKYRENYIVEKELFYKIIHYKDNWKNTINLAFDKRFDCGILICNIINRVVILARCF